MSALQRLAPAAVQRHLWRHLCRSANASRRVTFLSLLRSPQLSGQHFSLAMSPFNRGNGCRPGTIADGQTSALKLAVSYEANGVSDTEAQKIIDGAMHRSLCTSGPLQCSDDRTLCHTGRSGLGLRASRSVPRHSPCAVIFDVHTVRVLFRLSCCCMGAMALPQQLDQSWGVKIAAWGYVTLTIDRFGPRRLKNTCRGGGPSDVIFDAYSALDFLVRQQFIDPRRVVVVGFSQGGWLSLSSVERGYRGTGIREQVSCGGCILSALHCSEGAYDGSHANSYR